MATEENDDLALSWRVMATEENDDLASSWRVMVTEENKALARRAWEAMDNPDLIDEVYASDLVWHEPDRDIHGIEEAKQMISLYKSAFPDMNVTLEDQIAEGDKVVTRGSIRGTHQGETEEFGPPTGQQIEGTLITISRIEGGMIVEDWDSYDNLTTLQQLGLAPEQ
jgi:predicted ester cyclase